MVLIFDRFDRFDGLADPKSYTIPFAYYPYGVINPIKPSKIEITYKN
jgi:hypothetical protein